MLLHRTNPGLYTSRPVQHEAARQAVPLNRPDERIQAWLDHLQDVHINRGVNPEVKNRIYEYYYETYVIKPEDIPQSYWNTQAQILVDEGRGAELRQLGVVPHTKTDEHGKQSIDYVFPQRVAEPMVADIIERQKLSIQVWLDYLCSPESEGYPMWAKWWAFNGVVQLSAIFNDEQRRFNKRTKHTVASFIPLNAEALAHSIEQIRAAAETVSSGKKTPETNFRKIYSNEIAAVLIGKPSEEVLRNTQGAWVKYESGSDPELLASALKDRGTGWCTAEVGTARDHLARGDFHVYFSQDALGNNTFPRVALRMNGRSIAELRGIGPMQELDPYISDVVEEKLKGFPGGDSYLIKVRNMRRLSKIVRKKGQGEEFALDDLSFLYELDGPIEGLGTHRDERIMEMLRGRDKRADLALVFGCKPSQISFSATEVSGTDTLHHVGSLETYGTATKLPKYIHGNLYMNLETSQQPAIEIPTTSGAVHLKRAFKVKHVLAPHVGDLHARSLNYVDRIVIGGESIPGDIVIDQLVRSNEIILPSRVGGMVRLRVGQTDHLVLPMYVGQDLDLLGFPQDKLDLLPAHIGGNLVLDIKTISGLRFNSFVGRDISLRTLEEAHDLVFVTDGFSRLDMGKLRIASNVVLPNHIRGDVLLYSLESLKGVLLPQNIDGSLRMYGLTTIKDALLPHTVGGTVALGNKLPHEEVLELRRLYPTLTIRTSHEQP